MARALRSRPNVPGFLMALVWLGVVAVPLYFMVTASLRTRENFNDGHPLALPEHPTLDSYRNVLEGNFPTYLLNNVIVTVGSVLVVLVLAVPAAYAIVRSKSRFSGRAFTLMLIGLEIPAQAVIVPIYYLMNELGLHDTVVAVVLPTAAFAMPVSLLILVNGLRDIPGELYEAQALDGASPARTLLTLVLPLARPPMMVVTVFTALQAWNGFIFPLVLIDSPENRTLTLGLADFQTQYGADVPSMLAAITLSMLPIFVVYLIGRRFLLSGLTAGFGK
jgi:raffinose/stachyose/melibiose transport system permease protein/xylobiose transport system permease protein